jgi:hypothetical protein
MLVSVSGCLGPSTSFLKDDAFLCDASASVYRPSLSLHQCSRSRSKTLVAPPIMLLSRLCTFYAGGTRSILSFFYAYRTALDPQLGLLLCLSSSPARYVPLATRSALCLL